MYIAAILSVGGVLPLAEQKIEPQNVIYQNREDRLADTVKPRLELYGADCRKICYLNESEKHLSLTDDKLKKVIIETNARLLILDPIQSFFGGGDMLRAGEVRNIMGNLCNIAEKTNCAVLLIGHLNKNESGKDLYRGLGSIDLAAIARSIIMISQDEEDETRRVFTQIKCNLAPKGPTLSFSMENGKLNNWEYYGEKKKLSVLEQAEDELNELLGEGVVKAKDIFDAMENKGFSKKTIDRAKKNLNIKATKKENYWIWSLN